MLHEHVESAMDQGRLVIVPIPDAKAIAAPVASGSKSTQDNTSQAAKQRAAYEESSAGLQLLSKTTENLLVRNNYAALQKVLDQWHGGKPQQGASATFKPAAPTAEDEGSQSRPTRFKTVILDQTLLGPSKITIADPLNNGEPLALDRERAKHTTWAEIHNAEMEFLTDFRPASRNLFFTFVTTLIRRQYCQPPGFEQDHEAVKDIKGVWATPGKWFNRSTLRSLADVAGVKDDTVIAELWEEWGEHLFVNEPTLPHNSDPELSSNQVADDLLTSLLVGVPGDGGDKENTAPASLGIGGPSTTGGPSPTGARAPRASFFPPKS